MAAETGQAQRQAKKLALKDILRDAIMTHPETVLADAEVMRALIAANERVMGGNVVDLRDVAMRRLEGRLDRLEETHRSVVAAAYENLAGSNIIHRAVLQMLDPVEFEGFLETLAGPVAETLRVDSLRLVLESHGAAEAGDPALGRLSGVLHVAAPGFARDYLTGGRNGPLRPVVLRQIAGDHRGDHGGVHGARGADIRSEAVMQLDFGAGRLPGLLVLGAEDPHQFRPAQGTDLLAHLAAVFERLMRRWLA